MALRIRRAVPDDLDAAVGVWRRARWDSQPWLEQRMGHSLEDDTGFFRGVIMRDSDVYLAVEGGAVAGLLALSPGCIERLYVDPPRQGRGIGTRLLDHAKSLMPGGLTLYTHQRNHQARRFYEGRGFIAVAFGTSPPPEREPDVRYAWGPGVGPGPPAG